MSSKTGKIIYWVLTILVAFIFTASGLFKLLGGEKTSEMAKGLGGTNHLITLGILELVIVVLWFIPRTGIIAALLAIAYMGGALAVHFVNGQPLGVVIFIQILIWITAYVRFPELRQRVLGNKDYKNLK